MVVELNCVGVRDLLKSSLVNVKWLYNLMARLIFNIDLVSFYQGLYLFTTPDTLFTVYPPTLSLVIHLLS